MTRIKEDVVLKQCAECAEALTYCDRSDAGCKPSKPISPRYPVGTMLTHKKTGKSYRVGGLRHSRAFAGTGIWLDSLDGSTRFFVTWQGLSNYN